MFLSVVIYIFLKFAFVSEIRAAPRNQSVVIRCFTRGSIDHQDTADEAWTLLNCRTRTDQFPNLSDFSFNARQVNVKDTACLILHMFNESGVINRFNISAPILAKFILQTQRRYRKVPYHNWLHGFSVLQFSYAMIKKCRLIERNHFTMFEGLVFLTAAMCHDLHHPGTNNQFQLEVNSSLAQKYKNKGSILERHHIDMTFHILNNSETNFIQHLDEKKQIQFRELISEIILATDLSAHIKLLPVMKKMSTVGFSESNEEHKRLLRSIIISCADLSDQSKSWDTSRESARLVLTEFFAQGDQEKKLGIVPSKMMDRDKAEVPQMEVDFLAHIVVPNLKILETLYPETIICLNHSQQNVIYWEKSIPYFQQQTHLGRSQLDILTDDKLSNISKV